MKDEVPLHCVEQKTLIPINNQQLPASGAETYTLTHIDDKPTLQNLESFSLHKGNNECITIIEEVAHMWKKLYAAFNFDSSQESLERIEQVYHSDDKCCKEMFSLWLKRTDASWRSLIAVLESCDVALVDNVREHVGIAIHEKGEFIRILNLNP